MPRSSFRRRDFDLLAYREKKAFVTSFISSTFPFFDKVRKNKSKYARRVPWGTWSNVSKPAHGRIANLISSNYTRQFFFFLPSSFNHPFLFLIKLPYYLPRFGNNEVGRVKNARLWVIYVFRLLFLADLEFKKRFFIRRLIRTTQTERNSSSAAYFVSLSLLLTFSVWP